MRIRRGVGDGAVPRRARWRVRRGERRVDCDGGGIGRVRQDVSAQDEESVNAHDAPHRAPACRAARGARLSGLLRPERLADGRGGQPGDRRHARHRRRDAGGVRELFHLPATARAARRR